MSTKRKKKKKKKENKRMSSRDPEVINPFLYVDINLFCQYMEEKGNKKNKITANENKIKLNDEKWEKKLFEI